MRIIHRLDEMTETARGWLASGTVGFVPTIGNLHDGHMPLVEAAKRECEISVVCVFASPLHFATEEDYAHYPYDVARDLQQLEAARVDVVFLPHAEDLFPEDFSTYVTPSGLLAERLEAVVIPYSLRSAATTITKLFQLVRPDVVYFKQKDAPQVALVRRLVRDLNIDVTIRVLATAREHDGLAMDSLNHLLSPPERQAAANIYQALLEAKALIEQGELHAARIEEAMRKRLASSAQITVESIDICHPDTFSPVELIEPKTLFLIAARVGSVRLRDTLVWLGDKHWSM
ncbi:MAG TPA: pantoate--beta-alanine ligase [Ktedonobacteraceae bacterium]|nr:pantoate--beta-alanine ligase [Ktedonobacteraceae bacterium]